MGRLFLFLITALIGLIPMPSQAVTFTVNSTADIVDANPGNRICEAATDNAICTLRAAVQEANSLPGADAVIVPSGNYQLLFGPQIDGDDPNAAANDLDITDNLTLTGSGAVGTVISGPRTEFLGDRVFEIVGPISVEITGMTVQNGFAAEGGGIRNGSLTYSNMTLTNVVLKDNATSSLISRGGGLYNNGNATLNNVTISGNKADSSSSGGGIFNDRLGEIVLTSATLENNNAMDGGAIYNLGKATLSRSIIKGNVAIFKL